MLNVVILWRVDGNVSAGLPQCGVVVQPGGAIQCGVVVQPGGLYSVMGRCSNTMW